MPTARDRLLDAYEELLLGAGPAAATLDAVAAAAGVSKGGLRERCAADADAIRTAPEGAVAYHLRTSAPGGELPSGLTRTYLASLRVAEHLRDGAALREALATVDADALAALADRLGDRPLAWLVQLVGDGLYLRTLIGTPLPAGLEVADLLELLRPQLPAPG